MPGPEPVDPPERRRLGLFDLGPISGLLYFALAREVGLLCLGQLLLLRGDLFRLRRSDLSVALNSYNVGLGERMDIADVLRDPLDLE